MCATNQATSHFCILCLCNVSMVDKQICQFTAQQGRTGDHHPTVKLLFTENYPAPGGLERWLHG